MTLPCAPQFGLRRQHSDGLEITGVLERPVIQSSDWHNSLPSDFSLSLPMHNSSQSLLAFELGYIH